MKLAARTGVIRNTNALFARANRNSDNVILPINDCALSPESPIPAFYCVHSVSGVAGTDFLDLARLLEPSVRFYGVQAPPRLLDTDFGSSVEEIAAHYVDALVKFQPNGPIVLGGYCVGAVVALAMAQILRAAGREVGPLFAIDGAPENVGALLSRGKLLYWLELARNLPGWLTHGDLMRSRTIQSLSWSISNNAIAIGRGAIGLKRGERLGGGYAIDGIMDLSKYDPAHRSFINRLFSALFAYVPQAYAGEVVLYEAKTTPLLYLPQLGRTWLKLAANSRVARIEGTHIGMMHAPYVDAIADDMRKRIVEYFAKHLTAR